MKLNVGTTDRKIRIAIAIVAAILAVVVGGTTLKGGTGSVLRTVLGVLLVILMSNCLNLLGVTPYMQVVLKGAILVVAIWLDNRKQS